MKNICFVTKINQCLFFKGKQTQRILVKTPKSKEIQPEHVFQVYYTSTEKLMLILYDFLVLTAP